MLDDLRSKCCDRLTKAFKCSYLHVLKHEPRGLTLEHALYDQQTYVTTAFGFFSTAYTLIFRSASSAAVSDALTRGPRPAPTTIITLKRQT